MKHHGKRFHTTGYFNVIVELFSESLASNRLVIKWNLYYDHFLFLMHIQELRCGFVLINMWCPTCRLPCIHWFVHEFASKFFHGWDRVKHCCTLPCYTVYCQWIHCLVSSDSDMNCFKELTAFTITTAS